ncbi:hypothetical protein [Undibacterium umbellatum]|uniref:hypothetical protein n=1 Tax=Undibacterium umbellatum TaxID=2762300 RepID=UPI001C9AFB48|nr:hypothetical protein [Undibacterium umbellatum]
MSGSPFRCSHGRTQCHFAGKGTGNAHAGSHRRKRLGDAAGQRARVLDQFDC